MFNKNHKKKYLRYTDSVDDDNNSEETENEKGNIDLIIKKLEKKVNTGNIHSGNADVILKMTSQNQDTARTTKNNDSLINNISNLIPNNIQEKDNDLSQDIGNSIISVNSLPKTIKNPTKSLIDVDINLNNDLKEDLEMKDNNGGNRFNIILSTNNSNSNFNNNFNTNSNNLLSRNKILNINEKTTLSTLSQHLDNSKYFLNKKSNGLITKAKEKKEKNDKKEDINVKLSINEKMRKLKKKKIKKNKNIKKINLKKYRFKLFWSDCCDKTKCRRRWRNCNIITIIRDIFITIIIVSALAFYATIFIMG